jgi:hypothetical protein
MPEIPIDPTHDPDDIDRLFGRLAAAPVPEGFADRVLARTVAHPSRWPWLIAGLMSLAVLTLSGYQLGANLASTDGLDLLAAVLSDASLLTTAPGDVVAALDEVVPWGQLLLAAVSAACVIWSAGRLGVRPIR